MIRQFGENVITCQLATGDRHWYIIGCYLEPGDGVTIQDVEAAISERLRGTYLIYAGELNVNSEKTGGQVQDE